MSLKAGLNEEWRKDFLDVIKKDTRKKQRQTRQKEEEKKSSGNAGGMVNALSLTHMQGPLLLVHLGLISTARCANMCVLQTLSIGLHNSSMIALLKP